MNEVTRRSRFTVAAWISGLALLVETTLPAQTATSAFVVRPEFVNDLNNSQANPPTDRSSSAYVQGGHVGPYSPPGSGIAPVVPSAGGGGVQLAESSFGQMLAADVPQPAFVDDSIRLAQAALYPAPGQTRAQVAAGNAVFRYKELMYGRGAGGVSLDFSAMDAWFGAVERQKFTSAIQHIRNALKHAPLDRKLHIALLDAYYDRFVAEMQLVKGETSKIAEYRLGFLQPSANEFIIDREIGIYESLLGKHEESMRVYSQLLTDRMGVNVDALGVGAAAGIPLGSYLFQNEQPARNQMAAQFLDNDGILKTVPTYDPVTGQTQTPAQQRVLFAGYKDYVTVLGLLRGYASDASELARLHGMRGRKTAQQDDRLKAYSLIRKAQTEVALSATLLRGMFPNYNPPTGDASGVPAALRGIEVALADLNNVRAFLDGRSNALGFSPDFLVLIQEFPDSTQGNQFDSFDAMIRWIRNTSTSPINFSESTFDDAVTSYNQYKGFADQVFNELDAIEGTHADRYFEITGYAPGDTSTNHLVSPRQGSELWQVNENIALARTRVQKMREQTSQIGVALTTANDAVKDAESKQSGITDALNTYTGTAQSIWDQLAGWRAVTAVAQVAYDTISDISGLDGISTAATAGGTVAAVALAGVGNALVQGSGAAAQSLLEGQLDIASASFDAAVASSDAQLLVNQAKNDLNDLKREQISIALESGDANSVLRQETARRTTLVRELERLQQQMDANVAGLHDRYYADPIHLLRAQNNMILADQAFREAQRWIFFTARALEFKWNKDFGISWVGKDWDLGSVFKLRNFTELEQLVGAMEEFNRINLIGFNREPFVDVISLKNDVLAPFTGTGIDDGRRFDVVTKEMVSATELFRRKLARNRDANGNVVINLNTFALKKNNGFFFLAPRYNSDGSVLSAGKYLDKIEWIKFKLLGSHPPSVKDGNLTYGGTCYIRNRVPPCIDLGNSTAISGEYRVFPFFYFYTLDNGVTWQTRKTQEDTVKLVFSQTPGEPDQGVVGSTLENRFLKERSVAATDWVLTIPAASVNLALVDDFEVYVRHLFVSRVTPVCN
jgi:hypothetical protein